MALELRVGVHSEIITPPLGSQMAGFAARGGVAQGVHDDLHARALVVDDGTTIAALISVEIIGIDRELADRVREEICLRTGIPAAHVVISATHTHCGPATFRHFFNQMQDLDTSYIDVLG
ncbi:MAG: neutral/alkaline non-lysosomal ceramidase N-terminal domain-containing protein, partial [Bryobacteraceae bacterium]